jgi:hypothetical protein
MRTHNLQATLKDVQQVLGADWSYWRLLELAVKLKGNSVPIITDVSVSGWARGKNRFYVCVSTKDTVLHYTVGSAAAQA